VAAQQLVRSQGADPAGLLARHANWWQAYWSASSVDLGPDYALLESFYYGMQYQVCPFLLRPHSNNKKNSNCATTPTIPTIGQQQQLDNNNNSYRAMLPLCRARSLFIILCFPYSRIRGDRLEVERGQASFPRACGGRG
jgi:hypothetical protein